VIVIRDRSTEKSKKTNIMIHLLRFRHLFKEVFWITVGQAMVMIGSLVGVRLLTGILSPADYGELALGMTITTFVNQTILAPLGQGVMRFYAPATEKEDLCGYLYSVRQLVSMATIVIGCFLLIAIVCLILTGQYRWVTITILALIYATITGYNGILNGIQDAARQRSVVALHQGVELWLRFLLASLLIGWFGASSTMAMIGYVIGVILVLGSQSMYFLKVFPNNRNWIDSQNDWQQKIWEYSWPFSMWGIFYWGQSVSDRWALGIFNTKDEVGMYAVLFQLGYYPISMVTGMAAQFLSPIFFQRSGDGTDPLRNANVSRLGWRLAWLSLGITGIAFCVAFLLHRQIFQIFVAQEYRHVSYLLPWMVLSGGIFAASQMISLNLLSQTKTHTMMPIKIMTALLGIALNLVGAYYYGTLGIVTASVLFSVSCFISMSVLIKFRG
jgi:O-antigen/teichoic acid export membrane protein